MPEKIKAIGLLSGGLDSTLAMKVIHDQGVDVHAVNFHTGFCFADTRRADRRKDKSKPIQNGPADAFSAAAKLGIPVVVMDVSDGFLDVLHSPKYGYGKNVNPCVDCRIYMFEIAKWLMDQRHAKFVFTGEVLGQRPKSQHIKQLKIIARDSGLEDRLVRPLSARLLPETLPEREGWIDRSKLFGFQGRTRKPQMALAAELGIDGYPQPAGGCCYLTDPAYGRKVNDLWNHSLKDKLSWNDYLVLKTGRHLRVNPELRVIVGRDEGENLFMDQLPWKRRIRLEAEDVKGPVVMLDSPASEEQIYIAARITARYSDKDQGENELMTIRVDSGSDTKLIKVKPFTAQEVDQWLIR